MNDKSNQNPLLVRRIFRKTKSVLGIKPNAGVVIKSSKWIRDMSCLYESQAKRDLKISINSDVEEKISYPNISRAIECAINDLVENQNNSFKNMLVIKNPYQFSPLCAMALFKTKKPYGVRITVKGKNSEGDISCKIDATTNHRVPIMGLYADYENIIDIELLGKKDKIVKKKTFKMYVPPLKGKNSKIEVTKEFSKADYIYNLTLVYGGGDDGIYPYAFDKNGDIRFCFSLAPKTYGFQPISNGKFLFLNKKVVRLTCTNPTATQLYVVDQMGRFHKLYNVEKGTHHDFAEMENGNFVVGSNSIEGATFEDAVIEIDRKTGDILNEIKIKDYIDPKFVDTADWAHLNSIECDKDEKTVIVCLRNLHSVLKINYEKKELVWILGNPVFWENSTVSDKVLMPQGENMEWFFQAHASYFIDADLDHNPDTRHLIIYDNHRDKRRPVDYFDGERSSYVRIYTINEKEKTVSLHKSFPCKKSIIRSNAIFDVKSRRLMAMSGKVKANNGKYMGQIVEFDYDTGEVLNLFSVNYGYYRAYEFKFAAQDMARSLKVDGNYVFGKIYEMNSCEQLDVSSAKILPEPILEEQDSTEEERSRRLRELVAKNPDYYVDPEQDMARIKFEIVEDMLYIKLIDHLLERIYFVGTNHTYFRDFSDTKQERSYFARFDNIDSIGLNDLLEDTYEIYFKHSIGLYKSGHKIKIGR
ncbi:MAG: aryl-sulfate sulfotransferase [Eubacterium sp.]